MKMPFLSTITMASVLALGACAAPPSDSPEDVAHEEQEWTQVNRTAGAASMQWLRGHEDLTRFAVDEANQLLRASYPTRFPSGASFYPSVDEGDFGYNSANPLVQGNFATDVAIEMWPFDNHRFEELIEFYGSDASSMTEWQNEPKLMSLHFLRHIEDGRVPTKVEACRIGQQRIVVASRKALSVYETDPQLGLFWIGHVLHTIQDAFSPAHTRRSDNGTRIGTNDLKRIDDICTYGTAIEGVCKHEDPVTEGGVIESDRIWRSGTLFRSGRDRKYLVPEAEASVKASAGYLFVMYGAIEEQRRNPSFDVAPVLEQWLEQDLGSPGVEPSLYDRSGYFLCR